LTDSYACAISWMGASVAAVYRSESAHCAIPLTDCQPKVLDHDCLIQTKTYLTNPYDRFARFRAQLMGWSAELPAFARDTEVNLWLAARLERSETDPPSRDDATPRASELAHSLAAFGAAGTSDAVTPSVALA